MDSESETRFMFRRWPSLWPLFEGIDSFVDNLKDRGWGALQTYAWLNQESRAYLHVFDVGSEQNEENYLNMMFYALICFYWYLIGFKQVLFTILT